MNPRINNRICHVVEVIGKLLANQEEWQCSPESSRSFVFGACFSLPGSSAGTDALTDATVRANVLSNGLPRMTGYFCTTTGKTQLFVCAFGKVPCQELMCVWCHWETLVASVHASVRCFWPLAAWVVCCLFPHWNKFHSFGSCSYQTL